MSLNNNTCNSVFIATSLDGYISDKNGGLDWLNRIPNPENNDMGYTEFINRTDAIVMGRVTFETVCGFGIDWPYTIPVFVLSNTLKVIDNKYEGKVELIKGSLKEIIKTLNDRGYQRLYIDGGTTIQSFMKEDLIDELIITTIPLLLGGGARLFDELPHPLKFNLVETKTYLEEIVQSRYRRIG